MRGGGGGQKGRRKRGGGGGYTRGQGTTRIGTLFTFALMTTGAFSWNIFSKWLLTINC